MKEHFNKNWFLVCLTLMLGITSCRTADDLSIDPPAESVIEPNSSLANLMSKVALNDGSPDNIIDRNSNISIVLPVTVTVNGIQIEVDNENDYQSIEDITDASDDDDDVVAISYPITVVFSNYTTLTVNSDMELQNITNNTNTDNENDDDIECIDFLYPITASVFNEITDTFEIITINNDNELYDFIEDLDDLSAANLEFPITLILADGTEQLVNNGQELEAAIEAADDTCDEDDDIDFDDDDDDIDNDNTCETNTYTTTYFEDSLLACGSWTIDKLRRNSNNLEGNYVDYVFTFNSDGTILVAENANVFNGTWQATGIEGDIDIIINVVGLSDFNDTWNLCKINLQPVEKKIDLKIGNDRIRLGSTCSDGTTTDLEDILEDGLWVVASYSDLGIDGTSNFNGFDINFVNDGTVSATDGVDTNNGTWSVFANNGKMNIDFGMEMPFQVLNNNNWDVLSISDNQVTIHDISGGGTNASTAILTLQKL